jgi:hypothetical protein
MFAAIHANSWEEVKNNFASRPLWAFRGQADAKWSLETTLYREAVRNDRISWSNLRSRESWLLYQFRRFAHHYRSDLPPEEDVLAWLALIQHYGGPTRLLDFSYSLYVAAFFAVESAESDAAIWAINLSTLESGTYERLDFWPSGAIDDFRRANNDKFHKLIESPSEVQAVIHVEPDQLHERMWTQQGLFLAPTDPNMPFMNNLASAFGKSSVNISQTKTAKWTTSLDSRSWREYGERGYIAVVKIVLPREIHSEILDDLQTMNINAATLFPGLEGFARSLKFHV